MMPIAAKSIRPVAMLAAGLFALLAPAVALADKPRPWETGLQEPATDLMARVDSFHDMLLIIITLISVFVLVLLAIVMFKFNERSNPTPSRTTHNTAIEVLWTVIPVLILVVIAVPSFRLLYYSDVIPKADMTIKATGNQWYWTYTYPDNGGFEYDSNMIADKDLKPGQLRLLSVDNKIVVPVDTTVRVQVTANDVLHSWAMPSFGVKIDAVPGRLNETWFKVSKEGTYYGQCSELCGTRHGFMPIEVQVVSKEKFEQWVAEARKKHAAADDRTPGRLAQATLSASE